MNIKTYSKTTAWTEPMVSKAKERLKNIEKFLKEDEDVSLSLETFKDGTMVIKFQSKLKNNKQIITKLKGTDYYNCLSDLAEKVYNQALSQKEKCIQKGRIKKKYSYTNEVFGPEIKDVDYQVLENLSEGLAINELEKNGKEFYIFKNIDEEDKVCSLRRLVDGNYLLTIME